VLYLTVIIFAYVIPLPILFLIPQSVIRS